MATITRTRCIIEEPLIPLETLYDLIVRFIVFVPAGAVSDMNRLLFQVELAHWFYLDYYAEDNRKRFPFTFFVSLIFKNTPCLKKYKYRVKFLVDAWFQYKIRVPTYGAIILSEHLDHVLLVQGYTGKKWSFPKGKVNENEEPVKCAVREVMEEIGLDVSKLIDPDSYLEATLTKSVARLYIVKHVPMTTDFETKTRKEIGACRWFPIDELPEDDNDTERFDRVRHLGVTPQSFFLVLPFVKRIKELCFTVPKSKRNRNRGRGSQNQNRSNNVQARKPAH